MSYITIRESDSIGNLEIAVNRFIQDSGASVEVGNVTVGTYVINTIIRYYGTVLYKVIEYQEIGGRRQEIE